MKIAVVGSREWKDKDLIFDKLKEIYQLYLVELSSNEKSHCFISGGAKGVDSIAENFIDDWNDRLQHSNYKNIIKKIFKPDWNKYGKSAGFIRNKLIVGEADKVIAFWDGKSKGTKYSIDLAIDIGKPVDIYIR